MPDRRTFISVADALRLAPSARWLKIAVVAWCGVTAGLVHAQAPSSPSSAPPANVAPAQPDAPPQPQPEPPSSSPGLIDEIGRVLRNSTTIFTLPSPKDTIDGFNERAKGATDSLGRATDSLGRLARPASVATGRVVCQVAANGAPDCKTAADKLCQSKGFTTGNSIESDAAESCPAKVLMSGRPPEPGECRTDNYVTRALCQ